MANENTSRESKWQENEKLVLSQLEQHSDQLNKLQDDIMQIKMAQARSTYDISNTASSIESINRKIDNMLVVHAEQKTDIALLKWKIYGVVSILTTFFTFAAQMAVKFWTGGHN